MNAQATGRAIGIFARHNRPERGSLKKIGLGEEYGIHISGRGIFMKSRGGGLRAVVKDKPIDPKSVTAYLAKPFGDVLVPDRQAMEELEGSYSENVIDSLAFGLFEKFRSRMESGQRGWGQKGLPDLVLLRKMATKHA